MPSPFPGMDPWLESPGLFPDLHNTLIGYIREVIATRLPRPYYTAIATRVYVEQSDRQIEPDVDVLIRKKRPRLEPAEAGGLLVAKPRPLVFRTPSDSIREWAIEIRHPDSGDRLVTSVEVLSLSNKSRGSEGRKQFLKKQKELRTGRVNIVEIDLLRSGTATTLAPDARVRRRAGPFDYHVCVRRYYRSLSTEVYPIPMAERLPLIAIPLLKGDADVTNDLQTCFDRTYDIASFGSRADYDQPARPPLTPEQQAWAEAVLKAKGVL